MPYKDPERQRKFYQKPDVADRHRECGRERHAKLSPREKLRKSDLMREGNLRREYGLSVKEYDRRFFEQGGICAVCCRPETTRSLNGRVRRLAVDHDHRTGAIRGLLCGMCNRTLGYFDENRSVFLAMVDYLDKHKIQIKLES
jgi:hypothetical protein